MKEFLLIGLFLFAHPMAAFAQQVVTPGQQPGTVNALNINEMLLFPSYRFGDGGGFNKNLSLGNREPGIKVLQQFLNTFGFVVAEKGPGSERNETEYFGPGTKRALAKFQTTYSQRIAALSGSQKLSIGVLDAPTRTFLKKLLSTKNSVVCDYEKYNITRRVTGMCSVSSVK